MTWKVLVTAEYVKKDMSKLRSFFDENKIETDVYEKDKLTEEELLPVIDKYDGVITVADEFTKKVLDRGTKLKVITKWGTGLDSIDKAYAEELGIKVRNTENAFSEPVTDSVLGYILCFARNIIRSDRDLRNGIWSKIPCHSLDELTLGIIGLGNCGTALARKASALNIHLLGNDIREIDQSLLGRYRIKFVEKEELYEKADYVSLHPDLNPTSFHIINKDSLKKMKQSAVLINASRGAVVKTDDLIGALRNKIIRGAALDVFETEPLPEDSPLTRMENVILSPHNSNSSHKYRELVHKNTLKNLLEGLKANELA